MLEGKLLKLAGESRAYISSGDLAREMLRRQIAVLWLGIGVAILMMLFPPIAVVTYQPPWTTGFYQSNPAVKQEHRYRFILDDKEFFLDESGASSVGNQIGWRRLRLQWMVIAHATIVLVAVLRDCRDFGGRNGDGGSSPGPKSPNPDPFSSGNAPSEAKERRAISEVM